MKTTGVKRLIQKALASGHGALSEYDSKRLLSAYGVPVTREKLVKTAAEAKKAADALGYPVVLKGCAPDLLHKTEAGLVAVGLGSARDVTDAFKTLSGRAGPDFTGGFLVQEMVQGSRELMIGMTRDEQFGPSVMFGLGGIFTEVLEDVSFRLAPLTLHRCPGHDERNSRDTDSRCGAGNAAGRPGGSCPRNRRGRQGCRR